MQSEDISESNRWEVKHWLKYNTGFYIGEVSAEAEAIYGPPLLITRNP